MASHPSLARRVQAIRDAAPDHRRARSTAGDADQRRHLGHACIATRLEWRDGDEATHSLAYSSLADLRIDADNKGVTRITASDPKGRRWTMPLAAEDVARAQAALDVIDARVRPSAGTGGLQLTVSYLVALLCLVSCHRRRSTRGVARRHDRGVLARAPDDQGHGRRRPRWRGARVEGGGSTVEFALMLILSAGLLLFLGSRDRRELFTTAHVAVRQRRRRVAR